MTTTGATVPLSSELDPAALIYLDIFQKHKADVYLHLRGDVIGDQPSLPSYLPPAAYWTAKEKDLFFHGLSIFSRLRPDLVAMHIKTKSTVEVCLYLHFLETAAADNASYVSVKPQRNLTPPALDVSDQWVAHEENLAGRLLDFESCSWRADKDLVLSNSDCRCPTFIVSPADSSTPSPANAYLSHMDSVCLMTQESIIRQQMAEHQDRKLQIRMTSVEGKEEAIVPTQIDEEYNFEEGRALGKDYNSPDSDKGRQSAVESEDVLSDEKILQRRLKNRLYMRRKRAEKTGRPVDPVSIRLRPGREPKVRKPSKPRPKMYRTKNRPVLGSNDEGIDNLYEAHSQGGSTRPYRIRKIFQEHGVDAQLLSHMGIDLFNLLALSKLLSNLSKSESPSNAVLISAQSIHLFHAITEEFVSEMVCRTIVSKEQEIRMKRTMPVWKYEAKEITVENVAECLYSMGLDHLRNDRSCEDISENVEREVVSAAPVAINRDETPLSEVTDQSEATRQHLSTTSTKDQIFRTLRHSIPESMLWCSLASHHDLFTMDEILPDEMDWDGLNEELRDDEEFDTRDDKLSAVYETALWSR